MYEYIDRRGGIDLIRHRLTPQTKVLQTALYIISNISLRLDNELLA